MRYYLIASFLLFSLTSPGQGYFDATNEFFAKYVKEGKVDYASLKKDPKPLNTLVKEIAEHNLSNKRVTPDYMKAFYINAYNILVIKQVVDRYPIYGPLKVDGFFNGIKHTVMGEQMTLDELEKGTLYKQFPDPRLHFVLVCAAKGCPPLASAAYRPLELDKVLSDRTKYVLNLDWFISVDKSSASVSQIFDWYKGDFEKASGSQLAFINQYRSTKINAKANIEYYEYNWSLNE